MTVTTHRRRAWYGDAPKTHAEKRDAIDKHHASRFPVQHGIEELQKELFAFNERIFELEDEPLYDAFDEPYHVEPRAWDGYMLRLVDVQAAIEARPALPQASGKGVTIALTTRPRGGTPAHGASSRAKAGCPRSAPTLRRSSRWMCARSLRSTTAS